MKYKPPEGFCCLTASVKPAWRISGCRSASTLCYSDHSPENFLRVKCHPPHCALYPQMFYVCRSQSLSGKTCLSPPPPAPAPAPAPHHAPVSTFTAVLPPGNSHGVMHYIITLACGGKLNAKKETGFELMTTYLTRGFCFMREQQSL